MPDQREKRPKNEPTEKRKKRCDEEENKSNLWLFTTKTELRKGLLRWRKCVGTQGKRWTI